MKIIREHINEVIKIQTWTKDNPYKSDIFLDSKDLNSLPNNIPKYISGSFYCRNNKLTTLEFAPEYIGGDFYCNHNNLTTLEGAPEYVGGSFYCSYNNLMSLEFAPEYVGGSFYCYDNKLTGLKFAPEYVGGSFHCQNNNIPKEEVERYWKTGAVKGKIISDYGDYEPYKKVNE